MGKWFDEGYDKVQEEAKRVEEAMNREWVPSFWLRDGDEARVTFLTDEPVTFYEHWEPTLEGTFTCTQDDDCPLCQAGNKPSFRGAYLVVDHRKDEWEDDKGETQTAQYQVKIMKHGVRALQVLQKKHERKGLKKHDWLITRTGTGSSTQYDFESYPRDESIPLPDPDNIPDIREVVKPLPRQTILQKLRSAGKGTTGKQYNVEDEDEGVVDFGS